MLLLITFGCKPAPTIPPKAEITPQAAAPPAVPLPPPGPDCATPAEYMAINTRTLQSELTVGALSCNEQARYRQFVTKFKPQLALQAKELHRYFSRLYGKEGDLRLDQFVTRLANNYANRTKVRQDNSFCVETRRLLNEAIAPQTTLETIANNNKFAAIHGIGKCR